MVRGPSLGDFVRERQDARATEILCDTIRCLHVAVIDPETLQPLATRFAPLASTPGTCALHGDLHHDNILRGSHGWLAIDPMGVWGDPADEPANAFRNPDGAGVPTSAFSPTSCARQATLVDDFVTPRCGTRDEKTKSHEEPPPKNVNKR